MTDTGQLACPDCKAAVTAAEALAAGTVSWPREQWILFTCPSCGRPSHLRVDDDRMAIGKLDGAPGPVWIASAVAVEPSLRVHRADDGLIVRLPPHEFRYPARPGPEPPASRG